MSLPRFHEGGVRELESDGGFYEAYARVGGEFTEWEKYDVCLQKVDPDGRIHDGWPADSLPICTLPGWQSPYKAILTNDGGVIVLWGDDRPASQGGPGCYCQRVDSDGGVHQGWPQNGFKYHGAETWRSEWPIYFTDEQNGFYEFCLDSRDFPQTTDADDQKYDIYGYRCTGEPATAPGWQYGGKRILPNLASRHDLKVVPDGKGNALLTWIEDDDVGQAYYVKALKIGPDGNACPGWDPDGVMLMNGDEIWDSGNDVWLGGCVMVNDGFGGAVAVWLDVLRGGTYPHGDYFAQRVDANGNVLWQKNGRLVYDTESILGDPHSASCPDMLGGAFVLFEAPEGDPWQVVHLSADGTPNVFSLGSYPADTSENDIWIEEDRSGGVFSRFTDEDGVVYGKSDVTDIKRFTSQGTPYPGWETPVIVEHDVDYLGAYMPGECVVTWKIGAFNWESIGYTRICDPPNFSTYILLANPNDQAADVDLTFMLPGGMTKDHSVSVPAEGRETVFLNELLPAVDVSTTVSVEATLPIIAERSMYFDYLGSYEGGHDCAGMTSPSDTWYFAEGYTAGSFDTYLLLQNPQGTAANVTVTYMLPGAQTITGTYQVAPHARYTVKVDDIPGLESTELSMKVDSDLLITAERAMYFDYYGRIGGHGQAGVPAPSATWHLAEGYTAQSFDTYILVQNPGDAQATVTYSYLKENGEPVERQETIAPHSRFTVKVDEVTGMEAASFSTTLTSNVPVIAERAMYFDYYGKLGGHDSVGATSPSATWYLAEGYTAEGFDTFVLMENPGTESATVKATYMKPSGDPIEKTYVLEPKSRFTQKVDDIPGLEATEVSTRLETTGGSEIVAERAVYFAYKGLWAGGHDAIGVTAPSASWYFAEGYTGY
ncbi:MAG: hypothetical protein KKF41_11860 [Actinobacteria bacterium]|nr:hypothetical protein [Actinomycetota bacterium]MBU1944286.1 hypothetical protein [Actinomycetota bacterium]MBU2688271.1 hypothetical protein [Actinomycetota bacterium]